MNKSDCRFTLTWDYRGWDRGCVCSYSQTDWNQTLITKINQSSAQIYQISMIGGGDTIIMNSKLVEILKTCPYYSEETQTLSGRYSILIDDEIINDEIFVYNSKAIEPTSIPKYVETKSGVELQYIPLEEFSETVIDYYKQGCSVCIEVINYGS